MKNRLAIAGGLAGALLLSAYALLAPGGINGQMQYNCNGSFCGDPASPPTTKSDYVTVNGRGLVTNAISYFRSDCQPADPAGISNTSVMLGFACSFTASGRGDLLIIASGINSTGGTSAAAQTMAIRYGTGTAPAYGAALTGTIAGKALDMGNSGSPCSGANCTTFSRSALLTGLSTGTTYWIDLSWSNAGSFTGGPIENNISLIER